MARITKEVTNAEVVTITPLTQPQLPALEQCNRHYIYASGDITVQYRISDPNAPQQTLEPPAEAVNGWADGPTWVQRSVVEIVITCNADGFLTVDSYVEGVE